MGNPPKRLDLVVCTTRMNHMKDVDVANLTLSVETDMSRKNLSNPEWREKVKNRFPLGRFAQPEDIVGAAVYLRQVNPTVSWDKPLW